MNEPTVSRFDDYLDVFVAPAKLFERRSDGKFGQALLILVLASAVLFFVTRTAMAPIWDAEIARGMASAAQSNPGMTPEQMEAGKKFGSIIGAVSLLLGLPIGVLLLGVGIWIVARLIGKSLSYSQGATIATFAMFPRLVESVTGAVQALLMDEGSLNSRFSISLGIGRFLDPDTSNPILLSLLGRIDVFTIWVTVLIMIGLKVMGRATTGQAVGASILVWFLGAIPTLLGSLSR